MGLDMYAFKISKLTERQKKMVDGKLASKVLSLVPNLEIFRISDEYCSDVENISQFLDKITLVSEYIDMGKIRNDYKIPKSASICVSDSNLKRCSWVFSAKDYKKTVTISREKIEKEYTISEAEEYYVCKMKEVGYWRKDYDLEHFISQYMMNHLDIGIKNCGYYIMPKDLIQKLVDDKQLKPSCLNCTSDKAIVYHESY